jgi:hypothetical protein
MTGAPLRQENALAVIGRRIEQIPELLGAVIVGSLAAGSADAASDIDLIVCARVGEFNAAWRRRHDLHATGALACWDDQPDASREIAAHKWVTDDMVLVEALFAAPSSGLRLASPWRAIAGSTDVATSFTPRPSVNRADLNRDVHPVERTYDDFKKALRDASLPS